MEIEGKCIEHTGAGNRGGYKSCWFQGRYIGAHVRALIIRTGEQPEGRIARHLCGKPRCINADHLVWGSQADNVRDTTGKADSRVRTRVLSDSEVQQLRLEYTGKYGEQAALARKYEVSRMAVHQIVSGVRRWNT